MAATQILLAGHSHLNALAGRREVDAPTLRAVDAEAGVFALDGPWPRAEGYWTRLVAQAFGRSVGLLWEGNEHNAMFLFQGPEPFDFVYRPVPRLLDGAQIVTQASIRHRFQPSLGRLRELLRAIAEAGPAKLAVLGSPPPKKDPQRLRELLALEPYFQRQAEALGATVEITDAYVRLKLWRLLQDLYREAADSVGAGFVAVPPATQDEDGFLKEEYWTRDVTHANHAYGRLMLAEAVKELDA